MSVSRDEQFGVFSVLLSRLPKKGREGIRKALLRRWNQSRGERSASSAIPEKVLLMMEAIEAATTIDQLNDIKNATTSYGTIPKDTLRNELNAILTPTTYRAVDPVTSRRSSGTGSGTGSVSGVDPKDAEIARLTAENDTLDKDKDALRTENNALRTENDALRTELAQEKRVKDRLQNTAKNVKEILDNEIKQLKRRLKFASQECGKEKKSLQDKINECTKSVEQLEARLTAKDTTIDTTSTSSEEIARLTRANDALESDIKELEAQLAEKESEMKELETQLTAKDKTIASKETDNNKVLDKIRLDRDLKAKQIVAFQKLVKTKSDELQKALNSASKQCEKEKNKLQVDIDNCRIKSQELSEQVSEMSEQLQNQENAFYYEMEQLTKEKDDKIEKLEAQLKKCSQLVSDKKKIKTEEKKGRVGQEKDDNETKKRLQEELKTAEGTGEEKVQEDLPTQSARKKVQEKVPTNYELTKVPNSLATLDSPSLRGENGEQKLILLEKFVETESPVWIYDDDESQEKYFKLLSMEKLVFNKGGKTLNKSKPVKFKVQVSSSGIFSASTKDLTFKIGKRKLLDKDPNYTEMVDTLLSILVVKDDWNAYVNKLYMLLKDNAAEGTEEEKVEEIVEELPTKSRRKGTRERKAPERLTYLSRFSYNEVVDGETPALPLVRIPERSEM